MKKLFNNMLVPLFSCEEAEQALKKAVGIANRWECNIHLFYLPKEEEEGRPQAFSSLIAEALPRYQCFLPSHLSLQAGRSGSDKKGLLDYYYRNQIDLVLLGGRDFRWGFRWGCRRVLRRFLNTVRCPVLNLDGEKGLRLIRNIVLPVADFMPMQQLLLATWIARPSNSTIHLLGAEHSVKAGVHRTHTGTGAVSGADSGKLSGNGADSNSAPGTQSTYESAGGAGSHGPGSADFLYRSYRLLHENTRLPVECAYSMEGNSRAAVWAYAREIKADLILVSSGRQSLPDRLFSLIFSNRKSRIPGIPYISLPS